MRRLYILPAFAAAAACGVLLCCLQVRFPNPLTAALAPVNASPWETGKLVFWAMLPAALVLRRFGGSGGAGLCAAVLLGAALGLSLTAAGLSPAAAALLAAALALLSHRAVLGRLNGDPLPWYGAVILLAAAYLLFSILPPSGRLFTEQTGLPAASIPF